MQKYSIASGVLAPLLPPLTFVQSFSLVMDYLMKKWKPCMRCTEVYTNYTYKLLLQIYYYCAIIFYYIS